MQLENFEIGLDNMGIDIEGIHLDLHNNYDFRAVTYDIAERRAALRWTRSQGDWVPQSDPATLEIVFEQVSFFRAEEGDAETGFSEKDALSHIGMVRKGESSALSAILWKLRNLKDMTGMGIRLDFMSGAAFQVHAESCLARIADDLQPG